MGAIASLINDPEKLFTMRQATYQQSLKQSPSWETVLAEDLLSVWLLAEDLLSVWQSFELSF